MNPPRELKDCTGTVLKVGSFVAYNQSGNIVPGQIMKIFPKWSKVTWHPGVQWDGSFRVKNLLTNKISVVKRAESMMAIVNLEGAIK